MSIAKSLKAWSSRISDTLSAVERLEGVGDFIDDDSKDAILRLLAIQAPLAERLERSVAECDGRQLTWLQAFPQYECYGCGHTSVEILDSTEGHVDAYCPACRNRLLFPGFNDGELRQAGSRFCDSLLNLRRQVETVAALALEITAKQAEPALNDVIADEIVSTAKATHSPDFASVNWFGMVYTFATPQQRAVVEYLWRQWENKAPDVTNESLLQVSGSAGNRASHIFRDHPAWDALIVKSGKDTFRLQEPKQ